MNEILTIVAMLSVPNPFMRNNSSNNNINNYGLGNSKGYAGGFDPYNDEKSQFAHQDGDHLSLLNVYIYNILFIYLLFDIVTENSLRIIFLPIGVIQISSIIDHYYKLIILENNYFKYAQNYISLLLHVLNQNLNILEKH